MRSHARVLIALILVLALALPGAVLAQQLPAPVKHNIAAGVTSIAYYGQTLVFTTDVALNVSLRVIAINEIELKVKSAPEFPAPRTSGEDPQIAIIWLDFDESLYTGDPPASGWTAILNTEGGWTEK